MAKKIKTVVKLQIPDGKSHAGSADPPALGQHGVNIGEFVSKFNEATREKGTDIIPVEISVYEDRTFTFKMKTPPASDLLRKSRRRGKRFRQNSGEQSGEDNQSQTQRNRRKKNGRP